MNLEKKFQLLRQVAAYFGMTKLQKAAIIGRFLQYYGVKVIFQVQNISCFFQNFCTNWCAAVSLIWLLISVYTASNLIMHYFPRFLLSFLYIFTAQTSRMTDETEESTDSEDRRWSTSGRFLSNLFICKLTHHLICYMYYRPGAIFQ